MLALAPISTVGTIRRLNSSTQQVWRQFVANLLTAFSGCAW
jgi:hypothetical protein